MSQRVVVSGGAGFIGSHVVDGYIAAGYEATVVDNLSSGRRENVPKGAALVVCDIGSEEARDLVATGGFTILNHHAAQMDVRVSVDDPELDARENILGLLNLLQGGRDGSLERVVFASSGGVVYDERSQLPHAETALKLPVSPYGVSKLASEYYLAAYGRLYDLEVVSLRYANVFGPRQSPHGEAGVVAIFGNRIKRGQELTVFGGGEQTRDYVFVKDVARANVSASTCAVPPVSDLDARAFNVGTGSETSVNGLVESMLSATGSDVAVQHAPARPGELSRSAVSFEKAERAWGWRPEVSLIQGLGETYAWIEEAST